MSDIKSRVVSIIVDKLGVEESEVTNEASFTNDLGADWNLRRNSTLLFQTIKQRTFKQLVTRFRILSKTRTNLILLKQAL